MPIRPKQKIALLCTAVLLLLSTTAMAMTDEEITRLNAVQYVTDQVGQIWASGQISNDEIYGVHVDMSQISQQTVTAIVYKTAAQLKTTTTYTNITPQSVSGINGAKDKLTRFFHYFGNNNDDIIVASQGSVPDETVVGFVYGERKAEILDSFVSGIPECLGNVRLYNGGGSSSSSDNIATSVTTTGVTDSWAEKYLSATFSLSTSTYTLITTDGTTETVTMDVEPYVKDGRTYVPVRYLAYSLGVSEDDIIWKQESQTVTIKLNNTTLILTIGSTTMLVNGETVIMDTAPEIVDGRTMLPARWIAEALDATVKWDETLNQAVILMPTK